MKSLHTKLEPATIAEDEELRTIRRQPEGIERLELNAHAEQALQIRCERVLAAIDGSPSPLSFLEIVRTDHPIPPWREAVMRLIETGVIQASADKPQKFRRVKR